MDLFVFGSLRDPRLFHLIAGEGGTPTETVLPDYRVERVAGTTVPMLVPAVGELAKGVLWRGLSEAQMERLDAYELPWDYSRGSVVIDGIEAGVYFADLPNVASGELWSLESWEQEDGDVSRMAAAEIALHSPPLSGEALRQQWKPIRARAAAHVRAGRETGPNEVRRAAGHSAIVKNRVLSGDFYKFRGVDLERERFDGLLSEPIARETTVGFDASLVLPYDPVRDRVLLTEQFRTGPFFRKDGNPWMLEPVAGIVDDYETPEDAARREAIEEAGLTIGELLPVANAYPTPGNCTEFFYCYVGICDLPDDLPRLGGLDTEAEDIRLHLLDRERALGLVDSGEITVLPLIMMLYWLDRNRSEIAALA